MSVSFDSLMERFDWRPIKDCPGRFVFASGVVDMTPEQLVSEEIDVEHQQFPHVTDIVAHCSFKGGGLISFHKPNGFLHTLGDTEGMQRKLQMLRSGKTP